MLNNKSKIKRRARRFFTQRACFSAVADCTSTISGASLFQSRVTTLPATLKTCSDLEDAAGMAKMTLKIGARMDNGLQKIIETRQSKLCGFSIYIFDISKSKSMVRLVRAEKMVLSGLVFARKIARMIFI